ncbi:hypothetical protein GGH98_004470, partial [Coemansia sp. RSA 454]
VPHWWYGVTFVITFALSIVTCEVYNLMPWYWVIVATVIPLVFTVPIGIIQAISNQQPGLNVITEFIIGYARAGDPIANVTFKVYGYITMAQALALVSDQKLGHYMKIPPRDLFIAQLVGTIIAAFVQLGVAFWLMDTVANICTPEGFPFTCIQANTFFSASVIWGLVGPERMFGTSSPYHPILYLFILGALLPVPFWLWKQKFPTSWIRHVHTPLLFIASGFMPPAPSHVYTNWFIGCFFFNYLWHKYRNAQWNRYAFALSAGLDSGLAISGIVTYFAFMNLVFDLSYYLVKMIHASDQFSYSLGTAQPGTSAVPSIPPYSQGPYSQNPYSQAPYSQGPYLSTAGADHSLLVGSQQPIQPSSLSPGMVSSPMVPVSPANAATAQQMMFGTMGGAFNEAAMLQQLQQTSPQAQQIQQQQIQQPKYED